MHSRTRTNRELRLKAMLAAERLKNAKLVESVRELRREVISLKSRQVGATHEQLMLLESILSESASDDE